MASTHPKNMAAAIPSKGAPMVVQEAPMPTPLTGKDLIIRVRAVAINPVDGFRQMSGFFTPAYPSVAGFDASGEVYAVGPEVAAFKPGDRVAGFGQVEKGGAAECGTFQQYMLANEVTTTHIPDSMSFREAATFPMTMYANCGAFFVTLGLPKPVPGATGPDAATKKENAKHGILIWSAASSIGTGAVQIAKILGYTVYATASPKHHRYIEQLGADKMFDYNAPNVVEEILTYSNASVPVAMAYDCYTKQDSLTKVLDIIQRTPVKTHVDGKSNKKLAHAGIWPADLEKPQGIDADFVDSSKTDPVEFDRWMTQEFLPERLKNGSLKPAPPTKLMAGGLGGIQAALDYVKGGNVSGEKVVLDID